MEKRKRGRPKKKVEKVEDFIEFNTDVPLGFDEPVVVEPVAEPEPVVVPEPEPPPAPEPPPVPTREELLEMSVTELRKHKTNQFKKFDDISICCECKAIKSVIEIDKAIEMTVIRYYCANNGNRLLSQGAFPLVLKCDFKE